MMRALTVACKNKWSTYDLQTNGSVQNRIKLHDNGTISAVWTMSNQFSSSFSDRGTVIIFLMVIHGGQTLQID